MSHRGNATSSSFKTSFPLVRMPVNKPWQGQERRAWLYYGECKPLQPWLPYCGGLNTPGLEPKATYQLFCCRDKTGS